MTVEVVTLGEPLVALVASQRGPLAEAATFERFVDGAEANVAVGLARLQHEVSFIGRVGNDGFGTAILRQLRGEGVEVAGLRVDAGAPTGVFVRAQTLVGTAELIYYRAGSAGSCLDPGDLENVADRFAAGRWLHVTGITPALSATCLAAVESAIERAGIARMTITFDVNLRRKLWSEREARPVLRAITARSDIVFASLEEARVVLDADIRSADVAAEHLVRLGPTLAVIKLGQHGALVRGRDGEGASHDGFPVPLVVDPVGAGDAFVAGFIAARLEGLDLSTALAWANAAGAAVAATVGDMTGLPTRAGLQAILAGDREILR
jgi:2-dehydro-3-deoxygluconokinase